MMIQHSSPTIPKEQFIQIQKLLKSGMIANGSKCLEFKELLINYYGSKNILLTNSGTSALFTALKILKTTKNEVILPTYVCRDVYEAVVLAGFLPVLCDIDEYWNMGYHSIKTKVSNRTAAIIVPHNLGIGADVLGIKKIGIPIIEDCCQSIGTRYGGKLTGTLGDISVFSFNATKCMTTGEGGAVIINNSKLVQNDAYLKSIEHAFRMSDLQGIIGINQFKNYNGFLQKRKNISKLYFKKIDISLTNKFYECCANSNYFRFLLFADVNFDELKNYMIANKVAVRKGIDKLLHREFRCGKDKDFPNSIYYFNRTISIPIYPLILKKNIEIISNSINNYFNESIN